ncbi:hypothetical protein BpHYR1_008068 [Brachionus plicatilis]|uniref:Uncharacterized protein n=1 Tax=Brachionus plicatilis TaxID=10195 RepID=A0A3M7T335_BRAPC|nr:hypothetical protein BpHYR1_008068 [Brachionus plicatilis]
MAYDYRFNLIYLKKAYLVKKIKKEKIQCKYRFKFEVLKQTFVFLFLNVLNFNSGDILPPSLISIA